MPIQYEHSPIKCNKSISSINALFALFKWRFQEKAVDLKYLSCIAQFRLLTLTVPTKKLRVHLHATFSADAKTKALPLHVIVMERDAKRIRKTKQRPDEVHVLSSFKQIG